MFLKSTGSALLLLCATASLSWAGKDLTQLPGDPAVPNQLLVKLKAGASASSVISALVPGAQIVNLGLKDHYLVKLPAAAANGLTTALAAHNLVDYVELDRVRKVVLGNPNDPDYFNSTSGQWGLFTVEALKAWNLLPSPAYLTAATAGTNRFKVAVVDTGADCGHPDFMNSGGTSTDSAQGGQLLWSGSQAFVSTTVASPTCTWQDDHGHGTHVTGIIAAATSNATGVSSLGYPLQVMEFKVLDSTGSGTDDVIANAITAAVNNGARVISISLGGAGYSQTLQNAVNTAWQNNVLVVAAAGNSSSNALFFPAGAHHAVGVSASDINNTIAGFSNYGNAVAVAAPGVTILSTVPRYAVTLGCCNYGFLSGTSMATPFVSALAGLVGMATPNTTAAAIAQRIEQSAANPSGGNWNQSFGFGIIDAYKAVGGINRGTATGGVTGQIVDLFGNPVSGAQISVAGQNATTDSTGLYWLHTITAGTYPLTVTVAGLTTQNLSVTIAPGADTPFAVVMGTIYGSFTGNVTDQGVGVPGAIVQALSSGLIVGTAVADSAGHYTLWVPSGIYTVQASQAGSNNASAASQTVTAGGSTTVNLAVTSLLGAITGTVSDAGVGPISGAQVTVASSSFSITTTTNGSGVYSAPRLPAGTYTVSVTATGYNAGSQGGVTVTADATTTANVSLIALPPSAPVFNPGTGTYGGPQSVTITSSAGASIRYTTDGSTPTSTSGTLYTGPIPISGTTTINAVAYRTSGTSSVTSATYVINGSSWYNGAWSNRKRITIDHTKVAGPLSNFPVLISITDANLQAKAKADGSDILFTAGDAVTKLNHELELYNSATGQLIAWVSAPSLGNAGDTVLYMYYGNAAATAQQNRTATWDSNYAAVFHLGNSGALSTADATSNANNGTNNGTVAGTGIIGGGGTFGGTRSITTGSTAMSFGHTTPFTFEAWINPANVTTRQGIFGRLKDGTHYSILELNNNTPRFMLGSGGEFLLTSTPTVTAGAWTHVAAVRTPGSMTLYVNGAAAGTIAETTTGDFFTGFPAPAIGTHSFASSFSGSLDEIRVSATNRSAAWIATEYNNQSGPGAFASPGGEESPGSSPTTTVATSPAGLSLTVDGAPCTAPCSYQWTPGTSHTIAAAAQTAGTGAQYAFTSWSDAGPASHAITAPNSAATYTASFQLQYFLTTSASPGAGGTIAPASGWVDAGSSVQVSATVNSGYQFTGFSGALTGTTTPQNLTMNAAASVTANFVVVSGITVTSSPTGRSLTVDGGPCTTPCTYQWTAGSSHTIAAATQAAGAGTQYAFGSWSDGGAASHTVTAPSSATTYTANFVLQYYLTTAANPPAGGSIAPASGWVNAGSTVQVSAAANNAYQFTGFSGALTGTTTPQNLTMNAPASVTANFAAPTVSWYNTGGTWSNRKGITIDHTKVAGALTNFPVLISITDAGLQAKAKADGGDIVFTAGDAVTKLNHEIEQYNSATGQLIAWVNVPAVSNTTDTLLYMYYGNPSATAQQNPTGTWDSSFSAVFHLGNGTTLSTADSTTNANSGVNSGTTATAGVISGAGSFAGTRSITSGSNGMSFGHATPFTFEAWINPANLTGRQAVWGRLKDGVHYTLFELNANKIRLLIGDGSEFLLNSTGTIPTAAWTHIAGVRSVGSLTVYINGVASGTMAETTSGDFFTGYGVPKIGASQYDLNFSGLLDEVRVSATNRSAAWIATEYNNQSGAATFSSVGAEESQGSAPTTTITTSPSNLQLTVDGTPCTAPCAYQWTPGSSHTIAAATQAGAAGTQYVFASWSDGGAASHPVTAGNSPATYTANFTTQYFLTTSANPPAGGSIAPASGWFDAGSSVQVSATANANYQFTGFTGALTGTTTPQNLTMSAPLSVTANFSAVPGTTVTSAPAGRSLTVDGGPCTTPCTYQWGAGSSHTIAAATQAGAAGTQYVFMSWSDGGAASHNITASGSAATYTANFTTQYFLTTSANPPAGGSIAPASAWYDANSSVQVSATANANYQFTGFSGALTGTTTPQNLTMSSPQSVTANFAVSGSVTWYNTGGTWTNRKKITIDHTKVSGPLANFPVLVSITDANLQAKAKADGSDILFTAGDALTKLNHEMEQYNSATGQLIAWVNAPSLSSTTDTVLYLYYGNPAAAAQQNRTATWDTSFDAVFHLGDGTTFSTADATANANSGVNSGTTATAGTINGAGAFAGTKSMTSGSNGMSFSHTTPFTFEAWINPANVTGRQAIWSRLKDGTHYTQLELNGNKLRLMIADGSEFLLNSAATLPTAAWTHVAGVRSVGSLTLYINGTASGTMTETTSGDFFTGYGIPKIAASAYDVNFSGSLDEVRVSATNRSSAWIATEYSNQSAPGTFYGVGGEESPGAGPTTTVTSSPAGLSLTVDGSPCATPCQYQWAPGASHSVAAAAQSAPGTQYSFTSWSDGGPASHNITAPGAATTFTASYNTQFFVTMASSPAAAGSVSPGTGWYNAGASVPVSATPISGYQFSGFGSPLAGVTVPQNLTVNAPLTLTGNFSTQTVSGCSIFPANNVWNTPVDQLPVDANSATYITTIGAGTGMHPDFSQGGGGVPFVVVPGTQPKVPLTFGAGGPESDPGPYPVPANAPVEGGIGSATDRHVIVLENSTCKLYELYLANPQADGSWSASSAALFDLTSNLLRTDGWTSADAAGLPIFPGLVRYDEVAAGEIKHAIRITVPQTRNQYIWPARHRASTLTGAQYPPMGQRFRLKAGFNITTFPAPVQVVLQAMKKYGMILADNGSAWYLTGAPDSRWDDTAMHELIHVLGSDIEAVDESSLIIDPNSGAATQTTLAGSH